jgi:hypothetical protein
MNVLELLLLLLLVMVVVVVVVVLQVLLYVLLGRRPMLCVERERLFFVTHQNININIGIDTKIAIGIVVKKTGL